MTEEQPAEVTPEVVPEEAETPTAEEPVEVEAPTEETTPAE